MKTMPDDDFEKSLARTDESLKNIRMMLNGDRIFYSRDYRRDRQLNITIYVGKLTPEQRAEVDQIQQRLLELAHSATESGSRTLKGGEEDE
jgi:hypothetical protein